MWSVTFLAAVTMVNALSDSFFESDPRCARINQTQWEDFPHKEDIRKWAFAEVLGISPGSEYSETLFGDDSRLETHGYFCAEGWKVNFRPGRVLRCIPSTIDLLDQSSNAEGVVTIEEQFGMESTTTVHESESSSIAKDVKMSMSVGIPLLGDFFGASGSHQVAINTTYTRDYGTTSITVTNSLSRVSRSINVGTGSSECTAKLSTVTCDHESNGTYPLVATGSIGWRLKCPVIINGTRKNEWYIPFDQIPRKYRGILAEVVATISSQSYSTVFSQCTDTSGKPVIAQEPHTHRGKHGAINGR